MLTPSIRENLRIPGYFLALFVGLWLQGSILFSRGILPYFAPDILILLSLWCALKLRFLTGGIVILVMGRIAEVQSASPAGAFMAIGMFLYLSVKASFRYLSFAKLTHLMILTLVFSFLARLMQSMIWIYLEMSDSTWWATWVRWVPRSVGATLHGFWVYPILLRFESWIIGEEGEQQLTEDAIVIEERF